MGSWLGTCGITQLPIDHGSKIRAFIMIARGSDTQHKEHKAGFCHSDSIWTPFSHGIECNYQDYGQITEVKDKNLSNFIIKDLLKTSNLKSSISIESLIDLIIIDDIKYSGLGRKDSFGLFYVLEDIYQEMIHYNPITMGENKLYEPIKTQITDDFHRWYNFHLGLDNPFRYDNTMIFNYSRNSFSCLREALWECILKKVPLSNTKAKALMNAAIDSFLFSSSMEAARKSWMPQAGAGSQNQEVFIHQKIINATQKILDKKLKANDGTYDCDDVYSTFQINHNKATMGI